MIKIMKHHEGVGIAGPQVGLAERIFIVKDHNSVPVIHINPSIVELCGTEEKTIEGCLSLPTMRVSVPRYSYVQVSYQDLEGTLHIKSYDGVYARCVQHEMDHLDGKLIFDYITSKVYKRLTLDKYLKNRRV